MVDRQCKKKLKKATTFESRRLKIEGERVLAEGEEQIQNGRGDHGKTEDDDDVSGKTKDDIAAPAEAAHGLEYEESNRVKQITFR